MTQEEFHKRYEYNPATDCLGEGGFGKVFKAYDTHLDRWVAIKMAEVKPGLEQVRLKHEVDIVNKLPTHPNIARYEECFTFSSFTGEYDFAVLQYYESGNLQQLVEMTKLTEQQKDSILRQILAGIHFLHNQGIIHRDLKPQNILIVNRNGEYIPKITDFGISKRLDANKSSVFTNSLAGAGTLAYASPEQLTGNAIRKNTDLWSFGVIACWMFTGKLPFNSGSLAVTSEAGRIELFKQITSGDISSAIQQLPSAWQILVKQCIVVNVEERISSAGKCLEILSGKIGILIEKNTIGSDDTHTQNEQEQKTIFVKAEPEETKYQPVYKETESNYSLVWIIGIIVIGSIIWLPGAFNKQNSAEQAPAIDSTRVVVDTVGIVNESTSKQAQIQEKLNDIPVDFFLRITPASTIQSVKNLFGEPKKFSSKDEYKLYNIYFYNLKNCYLLLSSPDNIGISSICLQSKGVEPFVKIGSGCPLSIDENPLFLGKTKFSTLRRVNSENKELEVGQDRCNEFVVITDYIGKPCGYYSFAFGSFVSYGSINLDILADTNKFFENSDGIGVVDIPSACKIDYVIIGDENAIRNTHSYGEGVHCDFY